MRNLFIFFLCFALFSCSGSQHTEFPNEEKASNKVKNDIALRGLRGKIKSLVELDYKFIGQKENGQKKLMNKWTSIFNQNGDWVTVMFYSEEDPCYTEKYEYNEIGQKKQMEKYSADNVLQRKTVYHYSSRGNDTENINYTPTGSVEYKEVYKYDNRNNRIEERYYFPDEKSNNKVVNKYDDSCDVIEISWYNADNVVSNRFEFQLDNMHNIVGSKCYVGDVLDDQETKFENLDEAGNWQKETIFIKGKPSRIIERKIEYYR